MILKYLRRSDIMLFLLSIAFIVLQVYFDLQIPGYMNDITLALQNGESVDIIAEYGLGMVICALLSLLSSMATGFLIARLSSSFGRDLRLLLFRKVSGFSPGDMGDVSVASLVTRSTNDVNEIQQFVGRAMQIVIKAPIMAVWAISKISGSAWQWTAITALGVAILVTLILLVMKLTMKYFRRMQVLKDGVNRNARENIVGSRVIRAYNADGYHLSKLYDSSEELMVNNLKVFHLMVPMFSATSAISNFLTISIYWTGALLIMAMGDVEEQMVLFSDMIVFSSYAIMVLSAFMMMTEIIRNYPRASVSAKRIEEVLGKKESIVEGTKNEPPEHGGSVVFDHVSFRYPDHNMDVIKDMSFRIEPGKTVVIMGPTGCGKSTVAKMIQRFYDATSGTVYVDGMDVREYTSESLNSRLSYVPQRPIIFTGTIRHNVNYSGKADDDLVWKALDIAQISDYVESLDDGLDSELIQQGNNLSGGQKQRISIARAICHQPEIYIFDDSFSALDFKTERLLRDAIKKDLGNSTKIVITQRAGISADADLILLLKDGMLIDSGTHEELLSKSETYRDLLGPQFTEVRQ